LRAKILAVADNRFFVRFVCRAEGKDVFFSQADKRRRILKLRHMPVKTSAAYPARKCRRLAAMGHGRRAVPDESQR
jgi:hypothetical protein